MGLGLSGEVQGGRGAGHAACAMHSVCTRSVLGLYLLVELWHLLAQHSEGLCLLVLAHHTVGHTTDALSRGAGEAREATHEGRLAGLIGRLVRVGLVAW